jgi:hypothetical protein
VTLGQWRLALAYVLASTCAACGAVAPSSHYSVTLSPQLSAADVETTYEAIEAWQFALDGKLSADVSIGSCGDADHSICVEPGDASDVTGAEIGSTTRWAETDHAIVYLMPGSGVRTATHEVGHAMGLIHTGEGSVMCKDTGCASDAPTAIDVAQWEASR